MTDNPARPDTPRAASSPNDLLAVELADALAEAGLITDGHKAELLTRLKSGGVRGEDWRQWVDSATAPLVTGEEAVDE